ncbi:hypothetical protein VPNG_06565 [Cytospora leucostoma]|uniref:Uncharacterized protein n=1 Tax=Cytospora leucostoma TaxID=1230097 RepID=A0A423X279_9PEZI|nr:hypothetical protein VPNG_06565 [Cytospora leucostoma]
MRVFTPKGHHGTSHDKDIYEKLATAADSRETLATVVGSTLGLTLAFVIIFITLYIACEYFSVPIWRIFRRCKARWVRWRRARQVRPPAPEPQEPQELQGPSPPFPDPEPGGRDIELQDFIRTIESVEVNRNAAAAANEQRASAGLEPPAPVYSPRPVHIIA